MSESTTRRVVAALFLLLVVGGGCSDDGSGDDGDAGAVSTTGDAASFVQRDAATQLNVAATAMNSVAADVGLRASTGRAAEYCRSTAPGELAPHVTTLEGAADADARRYAAAAIDDLRAAIALCADGGDAGAVGRAMGRYNSSFDRLRTRIEALLGGSTP
jgi:hypothetical protein